MIKRGTPFVPLLVAIMAGLSGCGDSGSAPAPLTSTVTVAPSSPTASTAVGSVSPSPSPVLPSLARQPTRAGAQAFARYFFAVYNYAFWTADPAPLEAISDSGCVFCTSLITSISKMRGNGTHVEHGELQVDVAAAAPGQSNDRLVVNMLLQQSAGSTVDAAGVVVGETVARKNVRIDAVVHWAGSGWVMLNTRVYKDGES